MADEEQGVSEADLLTEFTDAVMEMYRKRNSFYQNNLGADENELEKMLNNEIKTILEKYEAKVSSLKGTSSYVKSLRLKMIFFGSLCHSLDSLHL